MSNDPSDDPSDDPSATDDGHASRVPEPVQPYTVLLSRQARRNIHENLPLVVALAAMETITGAIAADPHRVGKPLEEPFDGYHYARRGTYRIINRINESKHTVEIHSVRHRRDAYRT